jgi:hypothetical protein
MATGGQVLEMLLPDGKWSIIGDDYENIIFYDGKSITKKQFEDGFSLVEDFFAKKQAEKAKVKAALLERLGITAEEAALLLG